ncbi:hypothetical protein FRC03_011174 [Tulasnella sp. 419]|nr:hypothetical protein FRC02_004429 [Tulasnella sp. 418]KAG8970156.1 hypothetical protein FRC03_011174 [Tulasnella sp. 419]
MSEPNVQLTAEQIRLGTVNIRKKLKELRADEVTSQAQAILISSERLRREIAWIKLIIKNTAIYAKFLYHVWSSIIIGTVKGRYDAGAFTSVILFAAGSSTLLGVIFAWCFIATAPVIDGLYSLTFGRLTGKLSLVNGTNPNLFSAMEKCQSDVAKSKLANVPDPKFSNPRAFDYDIAKFLLQLSSVMYERSTQVQEKAMPRALEVLRRKGRRVDATAEILSLMDEEENEDSVISGFVKSYDVCYEPLSELATTSQAFCSLFWQAGGDWVVVAFKGTDPVSFEEWTTDFTASFVDASHLIPNFNYVHQGFKERLWPPDQERSPYDTIAAGIRTVTDELVKGKPAGTKINVWMTGHSLGTAIASLAYAKTLISGDLGPNALLRDAYLFATPIVSDVLSRDVLHSALNCDPHIPRTMWRVTNRDDFVATGLPALGDFKDVDLDPDNLFNFCHLGVEVFMKTAPEPCQLQGHDRILPRPDVLQVEVKSEFSDAEIIKMRRNAELNGLTVKKVYLFLQDIPIVGRLAAHATVNYWVMHRRNNAQPGLLNSLLNICRINLIRSPSRVASPDKGSGSGNQQYYNSF